MGERAVIAVDIGTGSVRAIAFAADGGSLAERTRRLTTEHPALGWAQQDPDLVAHATATAINEVVTALPDGTDVAGVAFDAQMYSVLAIGRNGAPLSPSLPWSDGRAAAQAERLRRSGAGAALPAITGCPVQPVYPLAKIRWLVEEGGIGSDARFLSIKDYVIRHLTGTLLADVSTASATGLLDVRVLDWSPDALRVAGIAARQLPSLAAPTARLERSPGAPLTAAGIPEDVPVWLGAGDAPLSSVGCGAVAARTLAINIGSSAAARRMIRAPLTDPAGRLWTYALDTSHWVIGGIIGSGGTTLTHVMGLIDDGPDPLDRVDVLASQAPPGADGLLLLPYFAGEQSPEWRSASRGALIGLTLRHGRAHVARAVLEGITFALRRVRDAIEVRPGGLEEVVVTGGACRSALMRQVLADVLGMPVLATEDHEGSARGAAALGWLALGEAPDLEHAARMMARLAVRIEPIAEHLATYHDAYRRFAAAADRLASADEEARS